MSQLMPRHRACGPTDLGHESDRAMTLTEQGTIDKLYAEDDAPLSVQVPA